MLRPVRGVIGLALTAALAATVGCAAGSSPGGVVEARVGSTTVTPTDGSAVVRYELTGTAITVDGTYTEPAGGAEQMIELHQAPLPWSRTFTVPAQQFFVAGLIAEGPNLEATVTCRISRDGTVIAQESGPSVDCRGEVGAPR